MEELHGLRHRIRQMILAWKHPMKGASITYIKYPISETFYGRKVLNLGCGNTVYPYKNVVNLDMFPRPGINCVWDLSKTPLPFEDESFDLIIANHILEHVPGWWECFKELARILKVGGRLEVWLPGDGGSSQLGFRDHINTINYYSFTGIDGTTRNFANAWEEEERKNLGCVPQLSVTEKYEIPIHEWWIYLLPNCLLKWAMWYLRNVMYEQGFIFIKLPPRK